MYLQCTYVKVEMINMKLYKDIVSNIVKDDICIVSKS